MKEGRFRNPDIGSNTVSVEFKTAIEQAQFALKQTITDASVPRFLPSVYWPIGYKPIMRRKRKNVSRA